MDRFILWFIRLILKDAAEYKVDPKAKLRIYQSVRKQKNTKS